MNSRNLSFSTMDENMEICRNKMKVSRDPMSHRIIEKRRRDRMNSCLADLSRLIPANYLKKGRGRIEKTEIIELAIKHLKQMQSILYSRNKMDSTLEENNQNNFASKEQFYLGYQECLHETTCYLVENENLLLGDQLCVRLLSHLKQHGESVYNKGLYSNAESKMLRRNNGVLSPESGCNSVSSFADVEGGDSQHFVMKKSPPSPSRFVSSPTIEVDSSAAYDCSQGFFNQRSGLTSQNIAKVENFHWQPAELLEQQRTSNLDSEGDVGNIGGMSTCSRSSIKSDEVYKYKTNIKERFNADQKTRSDSDGDEIEEDALENEMQRRKRCPVSAIKNQSLPQKRKFSSICEDAELMPKKIENNRELDFDSDRVKVPQIPIFALHPKGSYYVPLTINSSHIMPQISALTNFPSALHHIGISVSFASDFFALNSFNARTK